MPEYSSVFQIYTKKFPINCAIQAAGYCGNVLLRGFSGASFPFVLDSTILAIMAFVQTLFECRKKVSAELNIPEEELDLSMGMSGDFEKAVKK
jgi:uncharacterized pyridoxal phosphate-containing UPF0001 family protein